MEISHVHFSVRRLGPALKTFRRLWKVRPTYQDRWMAVLPFGGMYVILDAADKDSLGTIAFRSKNCDRDYRSVIKRGAVSVEPPADRPYGARTAYVRGPGKLTFEIDQPKRV
jgi:hypothetical protein